MSSPQTTVPTQSSSDGRHARPDEAPPAVPAIPMTADRRPEPTEASIGGLVKEASTHLSTLIRAEVDLAKAEVTAEVRKGVKGSIFFAVAGTILLFSLFFAFFTVAEAFDLLLPRWAAFAVTFALMLLLAALFGLLGWLRVRSIRKPERTITSVRESAQTVAKRGNR